MENFPFEDEYAKYLNEQNNQYKNFLDSTLKDYQEQLVHSEKQESLQNLQKVLLAAENLVQTAREDYETATLKIRGMKEGDIKVRRARIAKELLDSSLRTAERLVKNFISPSK